jgi:drug/metabolite transporter (DMT)-like permease
MSPLPSTTLVLILVTGMLVSGVANTLLTKLQDNAGFEQPVWQTLNMFIGESGCWIVVFAHWLRSYYARKNSAGEYQPVSTDESTIDDERLRTRSQEDHTNGLHSHGEAVLSSSVAVAGEEEDHPSPLVKSFSEQDRTELHGRSLLLLALPSTCDILGTTLVNVGLIMVPASIYQMVRGFLVVFVGLFSVVFLKRKLSLSQWGGLFFVVLGVSLVGIPLVKIRLNVGLSGALYNHNTLSGPETENPPDVVRVVIGVMLIAFAQLFTATQFVLEEFIMAKHTIQPVKMVGWEGFFGFVLTLIGMPILWVLFGMRESAKGGYFDLPSGAQQLFSSPTIWGTAIAIMFSIGYDGMRRD